MNNKKIEEEKNLSSLATNATGQLDVLWHDGDTLGVGGAQVGVLKQTDQVGLGIGLLQASNGRRLESQVGFEGLGDLTDETLERQLAARRLGALLVYADLAESDCAWSVSVRLLDY